MAERRNSLGFEFVPTDWLEGPRRTSAQSEEADTDSAFVDDDLESSWDQLRLRNFKEQLSVSEQQPVSRRHAVLQKLKRLCTPANWFANGWLDRYEKLILVMFILLIVDTLVLSYLLATYPVYRDILRRLGYQIVYNSTGFFQRASELRDL